MECNMYQKYVARPPRSIMVNMFDSLIGKSKWLLITRAAIETIMAYDRWKSSKRL